MPSSRPRPNITIDPASGATSAEYAQFLQRRLLFFGKFLFFLTAGYQLVAAAIDLVWSAFFDSFEQVFAISWETILVPLVFGAVWLASRLRELPVAVLRVLDAATVIIIAALFGLSGWDENKVNSAFFPVTHVLTLRAVIVPSSGTRTVVVSAVSFLPVLAAGALLGEASAKMALLVVRCAVYVAIATGISHVIFALRRQVSDAKKFGQYRLKEKIGEGGMGEVYKARHVLLRRPTAVKLLRPEKAGELSMARFEREVQLTSQLTHPNTVAIYDYGHTEEGIFYYAMEYLPGVDLAVLVRQHGPQPPARVIHLLRQVCGSLAEAHSAGLIHRDIKPENLILCERGKMYDVVKVVDFGLAKDVRPEVTENGSANLTAPDVVLGTPHYLPPEALMGSGKARATGDLYALGAVGYFLLTGKTLFSGTNFLEISMHHVNTVPEAPSKRLGRPVPEDLEALILACLEKEADDRPASSEALGAALERLEDAGRWGQEEAREWWEKRESRGAPLRGRAARP